MTTDEGAGAEQAPPATDSQIDEAGCFINYPVVATLDLAERLANCRFGSGFQIVMYWSPKDLDEEHRLLSEEPKNGGVRMADKSKVVPKEEAADVDGAAAEEAAGADAEAGGDDQAHVSVPSMPVDPASAVGDVQKIMEQAGGANGYAVILSIIAVVGGGAGWKFYQNFAKQRHEQRMKALEIEQAKVERGDDKKDDHAQCDAKNAALAARVEELAGKLAELESKSPGANGGDVDLDAGLSGEKVEALEKRLKALENWKKRGAAKK